MGTDGGHAEGLGAYSKDHSHCCSGGHRQRSPEGHADGPLEDARASGRCAKSAKHGKRHQGRRGDDEGDLRRWSQQRDDQRDDCARCKGQRRNDGRLDRMGGHRLGDAKFIARMCSDGVFSVS